MAHADRPAPPVAAPLFSRARATVGTVARVTYPYLLGGGVGYLALTTVSRDIALMFAGALLVLYGTALSKALQGQRQTVARGPMARNSQTALYINDPVKIVAGVLTVRQTVYVAGIVGLTYGLINATSRLPYGQSGLGQLHLLLIVGVPAGLGLLVATFAGSGTVEPYAPQLAGYGWRLLRATPRRLAYRATRFVAGRRHARVLGTPAGAGEVAGFTGTGQADALDRMATRTPVRALAPAPAPLVAVTPLMATPLAQAQRARLHAWLAAHPGATHEEIAAGADLTPAAVRPRRRELEAAGLVRKVDLEGRTRAGRRAARWEVVGTVGTVGIDGTPGEMAHG